VIGGVAGEAYQPFADNYRRLLVLLR